MQTEAEPVSLWSRIEASQRKRQTIMPFLAAYTASRRAFGTTAVSAFQQQVSSLSFLPSVHTRRSAIP
jgi:hypothetical protein